MHPQRAWILDLDNTLITSGRATRRALQQLLGGEVNFNTSGVSDQTLARFAGLDRYRLELAVTTILLDEPFSASMIAGAFELLEALRRTGVPLILISGSYRVPAMVKLLTAGIDPRRFRGKFFGAERKIDHVDQVREFLATERLNLSCVVGDGREDLSLALRLNCEFCRVERLDRQEEAACA